MAVALPNARTEWNLTQHPSNAVFALEEGMMNRKGFTLIELLIVVVIIGILAAIAIPKFAATKDKAKLASVKTDIRNFMTAQEGYFSDFALYGSYADLTGQQGFRLSSGNGGVGTGSARIRTSTRLPVDLCHASPSAAEAASCSFLRK